MIDFRGETIYFIVVDRFYNSDPRNDQGRNPDSYDSTHQDWYKYWGGDLQGIIEKLDYLQQMGISAIWITPVFDQVDGLVDPEGRGIAAYHGYWAQDFKRIDEHLVANTQDIHVFASNDTVFDRLLGELHRREMKLILDVVCNHSSPGGIHHKGELYDDGQFLISYADDRLGWYHHYGVIRDWQSEFQLQNAELCGLADFNENVWSYRQYIKGVIEAWLDKGVDGLRIDTIKHMPLWFWQEFISDIISHKSEVFIVGEWFQGGAYDEKSVIFANRSGMTIFDFALQRAIEEVLARNYYEGFFRINEVIERDGSFNNATELVTFIDNHDMPRFLSCGGTPSRLEMAINLIMTIRGIPCIYYGTEQYLHNDTNGGGDPYNRPMMTNWSIDTAIYKNIRALVELRRKNPAIQKGYMQHRYLTKDIYVYVRGYAGSYCLVAMNKGYEQTIDVHGVELPDGSYQDILSGREVEVRGGAIYGLHLKTDETVILSYINTLVPGVAAVTFQINGYATCYGEQIHVIGDCVELGNWDLAKAVSLNYVNRNTWSGEIGFTESVGRIINYKYVIVNDQRRPTYENRIARQRIVPHVGRAVWKDGWCEF